MKHVNTLLLLLFVCLPSWSQLRLEAVIRPRILIDAGYASPKPAGEPVLAYVTQRTRLGARFSTGIIETYVSFQDVRFWGGDDRYKSSGTYGNTGTISLHQGWFMVKPTTWFSVKVGRQLFSYDDQRILSTRNWNDYQVSYDAALLKLEQGARRLDLGLSWNSESGTLPYFSAQKFRTLDFLRYEQGGEHFTWSAIVLITGNTLSDTVEQLWYRATWGSNLNFETAGFQARSSCYYQHHLNHAGDLVSAWAASLHLGGDLNGGRLKWSTGIDYISGQDQSRSSASYLEKDHAFDLLYGRRHDWYGFMDYFSNMPDQGLRDYVVQAEYSPSERISLKADYHFFWLAASMTDPESPGLTLENRLGDELDLTLTWKPSGVATLQAGYSFFVTQPTLEVVKGVQDEKLRFPQFAYLMVTISNFSGE